MDTEEDGWVTVKPRRKSKEEKAFGSSVWHQVSIERTNVTGRGRDIYFTVGIVQVGDVTYVYVLYMYIYIDRTIRMRQNNLGQVSTRSTRSVS
jgi:hypothetical protein